MSKLEQMAIQFKRDQLDLAVSTLPMEQQDRMKKIFPKGVNDDDLNSAYDLVQRTIVANEKKLRV